MPSYTVLTLAALTAVAQAITITSPSTSTIWDSSESNTITWTSVSTDPETVDIYLSHQASQPTLNDLLFSSVAVSQGSVDVSGLQLPTGTAYQINFVKPNNEAQIYAQSNQFNVTGTAASATSTLAGYTGPTYTPTASSTSTSSVGSSTVSGTLTSSASSATGATTLTTSTGSSTTSTGTVTSSSSSSATGTSGSSTGSSTRSATSSSASATATGNSAAGVAASAPLAALVFGAVAMFA